MDGPHALVAARGDHHGSEERMIKVAEIEQTCFAYPSQWEGKTDSGFDVYVRYRWGWLTVIFEKQLGGEYHGVLEYEQLKAATEGAIEWPETSR